MSEKKSKFLERLNALLEVSDKTQKDVADELGYDKPNIISMFKKGITKVPLDKVPALAKALNADPVHMLRLAMSEYAPALLKTIEGTFPTAVTQHEAELIKAHRDATNSHDPRLSTDFLDDYEALCRKHGVTRKSTA